MIIMALLFGFLRGVSEGMDMSLAGDRMHDGTIDGVRGHCWYRWYHLLELSMWAAYTSLVWLIIIVWTGWIALAGLALLVCEMTEIGYGVARWGVVVAYEHINIMDVVSVRLYGWHVWAIHASRWIAGITIIHYGGGI